MKPLISIIVPVYKVEDYLIRCVDSITNQTYKNIEIILIDDGSPDNSGKICDELRKKDNRIVVIHKTNGGQSEARNKGLDIAKGEYIGFVDSDDYIEENMFETLLDIAEREKADIVSGKIKKIFKNNKYEIIEDHKSIENYSGNDALVELLKGKITDYIYNKIYKKEIWNNIRFPEGKILEDMDVMYLLIEKANKVSCTNKTEYYYVFRENSSISTINTQITYNLRDVVNRKYDYLKLKKIELIDLLNIYKLSMISHYFYTLSFCKDKENYFNQDFDEEYIFFKKYFKRYKKQLYKQLSFRKRIEINLLYISKKQYYYYSLFRNKIKKYVIRGK